MINYQSKQLVYNVTSKKIGSVGELSAANISGDLVLGTCWPVGTDRNRIVVMANLVR